MENFKKEDVQLFLDMDLAELSEYTQFTEESSLETFEWETEAVAAALEEAGISPRRVPAGPARVLFLMRAFYFLGVFRGGEAARAAIVEPTGEDGDLFALSSSRTKAFAENLKSLDHAELDRICKSLGL